MVLSVNVDRVRILVLGDSGVGKTSLVHLIANGEPIGSPACTIGCSVDVMLHEYKVGTKSEESYFVELWDVGGSSAHQNSRAIFYNPCHGVILVHDLSNRKSLGNLSRWLAELISHGDRDNTAIGGRQMAEEEDCERLIDEIHIPILIIGTKADLASGQPNRLRAASIADQFGADQFHLDTQNAKSIAPGSTNAVKLSRFFDKSPSISSFQYDPNETKGDDESGRPSSTPSTSTNRRIEQSEGFGFSLERLEALLQAQEAAEDAPLFEMKDPYKQPVERCILCRYRVPLDYKNVQLLSQFVSPITGFTYGRHITGLCIPMQRRISRLIMRAQAFGLMPYYRKETAYVKDPKILEFKRRPVDLGIPHDDDE